MANRREVWALAVMWLDDKWLYALGGALFAFLFVMLGTAYVVWLRRRWP